MNNTLPPQPPEPAAAPFISLPEPLLNGYLQTEADALAALKGSHTLALDDKLAISEQARRWIRECRAQPVSPLDALMQEYSLDNEEGLALMSLAEALLRVPDEATATALISGVLRQGQWAGHLGHSSNPWVNASTWGLLFAGRVFQPPPVPTASRLGEVLKNLAARMGQSAVEAVVTQFVRQLGDHFVAGETLDEAIARAQTDVAAGDLHSFDMLGEAALTFDDADRYRERYLQAITTLGSAQQHSLGVPPGVSIKLSALHPRYQPLRQPITLPTLTDTVEHLLQHAVNHHVQLTLDAEEADRLECSLHLLDRLLQRVQQLPNGALGLAVQAYQKRALALLKHLNRLARQHNVTLHVRLVKGAYWDSEIRWAQEQGLGDYPVFTDKAHTDISYHACAHWLLHHATHLTPQFASHNALTLASVCHMAQQARTDRLEIQRLHGMGETLHRAVCASVPGTVSRVYAPVGDHRQLLPYLIRRLLENGANNAFVHQLYDQADVEALVQLPEDAETPTTPLPLPADLYAPNRPNSEGIAWGSEAARSELMAALRDAEPAPWPASAVVAGAALDSDTAEANPGPWGGAPVSLPGPCDDAQLDAAFASALEAFSQWQRTAVSERSECLRRMADALHHHQADMLLRLVREGGRPLPDAMNELREAIDFCHYYAAEAERIQGTATELPGPSGEHNRWWLEGKGVFACISPWNFPLAIFVGQVAAALVTGNTVLAKPASSTAATARLAVDLFHRSGIPLNALQFTPCSGTLFSEQVLSHPKLAGCAFTGSTATAWQINRTLAARDAAIVPFIAETGGLNAMLVDSSALLEQTVEDIITSAFNSAGQRCSALRLLCVQDDIADDLITLLKGAIATLTLGDPMALTTDIGPLISAPSNTEINAYIEQQREAGRDVWQADVHQHLNNAHLIAPTLISLGAVDDLKQEVFGPVLHWLSFPASALNNTVDALNAMHYGLTFGIQSRLQGRAQLMADEARAGNVYINRNMIGATVGVHPFGGHGLSGTGPKAGGPLYLTRFCQEKTVSDNVAALGGVADLLR